MLVVYYVSYLTSFWIRLRYLYCNPAGKSGVGGHDTGLEAPKVGGELGQKDVTKELPEYLKQKLKARGILKDEAAEGYAVTDNASSFWTVNVLIE